MADELVYDADKGETGLTLYAVLEVTDAASSDFGEFWNGSAWEARTAANWTDYDIALTEGTDNFQYTGDMPTIATANVLTVHIYEQAGGTPATDDPRLASQEFLWTGSKLLSQTKAMEAILAVVAGNAAHTESSGVTVFQKTDNSSTAVTNTVSDVGDRTSLALS